MKCARCDASVPAEAAFCSQCGQPVEPESDAPRRSSTSSGVAARGKDIDDEERELWQGTFSGKGMINYWIVAALATVIVPAMGFAAGFDSGPQWLGLFAIVVVLWIVLGCLLVYQKLNVHYVLTTQRLIHKSGILIRHSHRVEVIDFDDVSYRQGIIERLLGVGTIEITSSDRSDPHLLLPGIDEVHRVANLMDEARREERLRRGLHIEAV